MITFTAGKLDGSLPSKALVIAVDLGFAQKGTKSTGVAWRRPGDRVHSSNFTFGNAIDHCRQLLEGNAEAVLIIEAPLSCAFDDTGNPRPRLPLEKKGSSTRSWYVGAGAAVCLAAHFFLKALAQAVQHQLRVHLIEGFASFKKHGSNPTHAEEARMLLDSFLQGKGKAKIEPPPSPLPWLVSVGIPDVLKIGS